MLNSATVQPSSPQARLAGFLAKYNPEIAAVARAVLARMRARLPGATQMVYDNYNALVIGFGPNERASEAIFSVVLYPKWVSFFFLQGAALADPGKVLKGAGRVVRHMVLKDAADLDQPAVRALMEQALKKAKTPMDTAGRGRMIIKSVSEKQRRLMAIAAQSRRVADEFEATA